MVKRRLYAGLILLLWLGTTAWLVRYEAFPGFFTRRLDGYKDVLGEDLLASDQWFKILSDGVHVGYGHSQLLVEETDPLIHFELRQTVMLQFRVWGQAKTLSATAVAALDALYQLQRFDFAAMLGNVNFSLLARRNNLKEYDIQWQSPAGRHTTRLALPKDFMLYSPVVDLALRTLKPGQTVTLRVLDPITLALSDIPVTARRRETITVTNTLQEATLLESRYGGRAIYSWLAPDGRLLRQETPWGWTFEAASSDAAMAIGDNAIKAWGIFQMLSGLLKETPASTNHPPRTGAAP